MKLKKEDLIRLSKERLVEIILEMQDERPETPTIPWTPFPYYVPENPPCWAPGGYCMNPQRDCVNCPRSGYNTGTTWSTTTTQTNLEGTAFPGNSELQGNSEKKPIND